MNKTILLLICFSAKLAIAQPKVEAFQTFEKLVGGTWVMESKWPDGTTFKQEYKLEWGLNKEIVKVKTFGIVNKKKNEYGLRNEGIRAWNAKKSEMIFYEFDVFGGIVEGKCTIEGLDIYYEYEYEQNGKKELFNDVWKYMNDSTYMYSVKMKTIEGWNVLMTNEIKRIN